MFDEGINHSESMVSGESGFIDSCISEEMMIDQLFGGCFPDEVCVGEYSLLKFTESEGLTVYSVFRGDDYVEDLFHQDGHFYLLFEDTDDSEEVLTVGDFLSKIK